MAPDPDTYDPVCGAGCGSWISAEVINTLLPRDFADGARENPYRVEAFGIVRCPRCKTLLVDLYAGIKPLVSFARCAEHGVWIDCETRLELLAAYATLIEEDKEIRDEVDALADVEPRELARRVVRLERKVAELTRELDELGS